MTKIQLLDCTLRDGGYLVNQHFDEDAIYNIVHGLTKAGVDFVELGFLRDEFEQEENICYKDSRGVRTYIPENRGNTLYTVFADYSRYSVSNLDDYDGRSFDGIRACFSKEEQKDALEFCRNIKRKGYKVFVQPMGVLRYKTPEFLELINEFNKLRPYCFGIVDTFGSMFLEDLRVKIDLAHKELHPDIKLGFHSHNNKEMANALTMEFLNILKDKRDTCADATLYGMGRGAGNTRTEVIVDYMNKRLGKNYDLAVILDIIDNSVQSIAQVTKWGYDLQMYLGGATNSHVNNINYLIQKAGLRTRDIFWILNCLTDNERARYVYPRLDELYMECMRQLEGTRGGAEALRPYVKGRLALIVAPGDTVNTHIRAINAFIAERKPLVISINFIPETFKADFVYFNNPRRFDYFDNTGKLAGQKTILTTNVKSHAADSIIIPIEMVLRGVGDNSTILLLNLLDTLGADEIALAGFDGFTDDGNNYVTNVPDKSYAGTTDKNAKIKMMFDEFINRTSIRRVSFLTPSRFEINGS